VLIIEMTRDLWPKEAGWVWAKANVVRFDLEEILGVYVHISWNNR
jgi:hypothetical protein